MVVGFTEEDTSVVDRHAKNEDIVGCLEVEGLFDFSERGIEEVNENKGGQEEVNGEREDKTLNTLSAYYSVSRQAHIRFLPKELKANRNIMQLNFAKVQELTSDPHF